MNFLETIGKALRPLRSSDSQLIEASSAVANVTDSIIVFSSNFQNSQTIPVDFTADGAGKFPGLLWSGVPEGCKSLLLVVEDPDAPKPTPFIHGIFYNIPADFSELPETAVTDGEIAPKFVDLGLRLGTNTVGKALWTPPSPPPGHGTHHYHFQLIALNTMLGFDAAPSLGQIKDAIEGKVLGAGELIGVYER